MFILRSTSRFLTVTALVAGALSVSVTTTVSASPVKEEVRRPTVGTPCASEGVRRNGLVCRSNRTGALRWRRLSANPAQPSGPRVVDGLPFASTLPSGLSARDVAVAFARDWNAYRACLNWGPERNNSNGYSAGPVTSRCNQSVWGVANAYREVREGRMSETIYYAPIAALWDKYASYGVTLRHSWCPMGYGSRLVCEDLPVGWWQEHLGVAFQHHFDYPAVRLDFEGSSWVVFQMRSLEDLAEYRTLAAARPGDAHYLPGVSERFAATVLDPAFWEVPGCRLLDDHVSSCDVRMAVPAA